MENYHCHKDFTNLNVIDCAESIENYAERTKEYGAKCLFSGEHGSQGNQFHVYKVAEQNGLKYRHSCEAYWVKNRHEKDRTNCHMMIVAKNPEGRKDLNYILSVAQESGYYYQPRIDLELLMSVKPENFIVTSACFTKGNKVLTNAGYKDIEDIRSGDVVKNRYGKWERVNCPTTRFYSGDGYRFKLEGKSDFIECTKDHKFLCSSPYETKQGRSASWKTIEQIIKEKSSKSAACSPLLLEPVNVEYSQDNHIYIHKWYGSYFPDTCKKKKYHIPGLVEITSEVMALFGFFIGDGSLSEGKNPRFALTINLEESDKHMKNFIVSALNEFNVGYSYSEIKEKNRADLTVSSTEFYNVVHHYFGRTTAVNKHIPKELIHVNKGLDIALLYGLLMSDGSFRVTQKDNYNSGRMTYTTISRRLADDFVSLCNSLEIKTTMSVVPEYTDKQGVHHCESYRIESSSKIWAKIDKKNPPTIKQFAEIVNNFYTNSYFNPFVTIDGIRYRKYRITQYEKIVLNEQVYCLNNSSHSFVVNGVVVHNCVAGHKYEDSDEIWLKIAKHFGDNFFIEVQNHNTDKQKKLNAHLVEFAKENNLQLICGLDSHYVLEENRAKREWIQKYKKIEYNSDEDGWYMDYPDTSEVIRRFEHQGVLSEAEILEAIMNTNIFVNECEEIEFDRHFKIPNIYPELDYEGRVKKLKQIVTEEYKKDPNKSKEKKEGIRWEVNQYVESGTVDYPLMSKAIVDLAVGKYSGVLTKTSRGSAASFFTNNLMHLTTVDRFNAEVPIYPERFLTKERILSGAMPDCDLNLQDPKPFVLATRELLGEHSCYPMLAVSKLQEKAAWKLYAGSQNVEPAVANSVSKSIDLYNDAVKHSDGSKEIKIEDYIPAEFFEIYKESRSYQGVTIGATPHPCGNLVFDGDIRREIGLMSVKSESKKERTLVAAVEGKYLDEFGYVKEDFLIVDTVALTEKLFQSIGKPTPSFTELKEMVKGDKATWDIYAKGITCCVNQCEQEGTRKKAMKYKPQTIGELAAFIAGVRPGFASLINNFLNRRPYTTGEPKIDKLLEDSSHYLLYQESIMKVLGFLGLEMGETYQTIKAISKKKLKGQMKEDLMKKLKESWMKEFGNLDNFEKVWKVINDAAKYSFNSVHAYSMAGDSLYNAWFKAHHTAKFYEVAISHYQEKDKKDKIDALIREAMECYGFSYGDYRFGVDNRKVTVDEANMIINPNLSSIKGFGDKVAGELWEIANQNPKTFMDVAILIRDSSINKALMEKLIKLNYFEQFGGIKKLLAFEKMFDEFYLKKSIKKDKLVELGYDPSFFAKYGKETDKMISKFDSSQFLGDYFEQLPEIPSTPWDIIRWEYEVTEIASHVDPNIEPNTFFVTKVEVKPKIIHISLYDPRTGKEIETKMWRSNYEKLPFDSRTVLKIPEFKQTIKREPTGEVNKETGKRIYAPVPGKYETWIEQYRVIE